MRRLNHVRLVAAVHAIAATAGVQPHRSGLVRDLGVLEDVSIDDQIYESELGELGAWTKSPGFSEIRYWLPALTREHAFSLSARHALEHGFGDASIDRAVELEDDGWYVVWSR